MAHVVLGCLKFESLRIVCIWDLSTPLPSELLQAALSGQHWTGYCPQTITRTPLSSSCDLPKTEVLDQLLENIIVGFLEVVPETQKRAGPVQLDRPREAFCGVKLDERMIWIYVELTHEVQNR